MFVEAPPRGGLNIKPKKLLALIIQLDPDDDSCDIAYFRLRQMLKPNDRGRCRQPNQTIADSGELQDTRDCLWDDPPAS
jgi:hypothetical protein